MTIQELLKKRGETSLSTAEIILAAVCEIDRTTVIAHPERHLQSAQVRRFHQLIKRAAEGEPLAYLLGVQPFYGLNFLVNEQVLIPRSETEWLVEQALQTLATNPAIKTVIDVGTGSGCIIVSLYTHCPAKLRNRITWLATDISAAALKVAKNNAKRHDAKNIKFIKADLLNFRFPSNDVLVIANLPYLTTRDYKETPKSIRGFEPKQALVAGSDGLVYYKKLIGQIRSHLTRSSQTGFHCLWEIDPCHASQLQALAAQELGRAARIEKDFNDQKRYLQIK